MYFRQAFRAALGAAALSILAGASGAAAAEAGGIGMELNRLQQVDDTCRLIVVFTNRLAIRIDSLEVETVLFGGDGRAERFLLLKSQPLPPGKIRVHQYDLSDTSCATIGSVLINDVVGCQGEGLDPAACLAALSASSRESVPLYAGTAEPAPASAGEAPAGPSPAP